MRPAPKTIAVIGVFVASLALVVIGQRGDGWPALGLMLVGLAGLLTLLFLYNKRYR